jgi:hypothetical protein
MHLLDKKLNDMKQSCITEIKTQLFSDRAWNHIFTELDKETIGEEWMDYVRRWVNTLFNSPERKNIENNPKYERARTLQEKYHSLLGSSKQDIEENLGSIRDTKEALEVYRQVCNIWG